MFIRKWGKKFKIFSSFLCTQTFKPHTSFCFFFPTITPFSFFVSFLQTSYNCPLSKRTEQQPDRKFSCFPLYADGPLTGTLGEPGSFSYQETPHPSKQGAEEASEPGGQWEAKKIPTGQALLTQKWTASGPPGNRSPRESSLSFPQPRPWWTSSLWDRPFKKTHPVLGCVTCLQSQNSVAQNTGTWLFFFFFLSWLKETLF